MSRPSIKLEVSPSYQKQYISTAPTGSGDGYIKQKVLEQWLKENEAKVGTKWDYAVRPAAMFFDPRTNASRRYSTI